MKKISRIQEFEGEESAYSDSSDEDDSAEKGSGDEEEKGKGKKDYTQDSRDENSYG